MEKTKIMKPSAAVAALDAISAKLPNVAHDQADEILLASVKPEVRAAYERLVDRCAWWVTE